MILTMLKRNREKDAHVKGGGWKHESLSGIYLGRREEDGYAGLTVGIVRFRPHRRAHGGAPQAVGRAPDRLRPLRRGGEIRPCTGVEKVDLDTLLRESDIVTLHPTLNPTSRGMMGAEQFRAMKKTALFVNTSRGGTQDEVALADAVRGGRDRRRGARRVPRRAHGPRLQAAPDGKRGAAVAAHDLPQPGRRARPRDRMGGGSRAHRTQGRGAGKRSSIPMCYRAGANASAATR